MPDQNDTEFIRQQQRAVERMREMERRAANQGNKNTVPPAPPFVKMSGNSVHETPDPPKSDTQQNAHSETPNEPFDTSRISSFIKRLPLFSGGIKTDPDLTLIMGLFFILSSENADRYLLFALLYILI